MQRQFVASKWPMLFYNCSAFTANITVSNQTLNMLIYSHTKMTRGHIQMGAWLTAAHKLQLLHVAGI